MMSTIVSFFKKTSRRFYADRRGGIAVVFAVSLLPMLIAVGVGVDAARGFLVKTRLQTAVESAALAVGSSDGTNDELIAVMHEFFNKNFPAEELGAPATAELEIIDDTIMVSASAEIQTTLMALGGFDTIAVAAAAEVIRETKGLEVALVLDVTGSMAGSKMNSLKEASSILVDILYGNNDYHEGVKVSVVPYSATVNIGTKYADFVNGSDDDAPYTYCTPEEEWTTGESWHQCVRMPNETACSGGSPKATCEWVDEQVPAITECQNYTSYSSCKNAKTRSSKTGTNNSGEWVDCEWRDGECRPEEPVESNCIPKFRIDRWVDAIGNVGQPYSDCQKIAEWKGCVLARPYPLDTNDDGPDVMKWDKYYWASAPGTPSPYFVWPPVDERASEGNDARGPNVGCPSEIIPLTHEKKRVADAIDDLVPWSRGGTFSNFGMVWGWRALSPTEPFTEGSEYNDPNFRKVAVLMTDGENGYYQQDYSAYEWVDEGNLGTTNRNRATDEINDRLVETCENMKDEGITIYTVTFDLKDKDTIEVFRKCASDEDKHFDSPSPEDLKNAFRAIGNQLSNLRVSK